MRVCVSACVFVCVCVYVCVCLCTVTHCAASGADLLVYHNDVLYSVKLYMQCQLCMFNYRKTSGSCEGRITLRLKRIN